MSARASEFVRGRFFDTIAIALALFTIVGFARTYYFRFLTDLPPLAALVIALGFATVAVKANEIRIHPSGLTPPQFTAVGVTSLGLFAVFTGAGIALRRRAALHKRCMVLAMIAVLTPASSRVLTMLGMREHWTYLVPVVPALFITWCLVADWRRHRIVHPVFAIGGLAIVASWPLRLMAGRSEWYQPVGEWIAHLGR